MYMTHSFDRYTAAGNTFLVMNTWEDPLSLSREEMRELVRGACDYKTGAGADGLILINQPPSPNLSPRRGEEQVGVTFRMDFYNPDGTTGMLCGNGARCAAQAAKQYGFVNSDTVNFEVLGAINTAEFLPNGAVRVYFQDPSVIRLNFELLVEDGKSVAGNYVDLGSQHVILFWDNDPSPQPSPLKGRGSLDEMDIAHFGPLLRWHPEFAPKGANANFIEVREDGDEQYLRIRTFERGVEGETLACGTGCMSSAIVARLTNRILKLPIRLLTQSGEFVTVNFKLNGEHVSNLSLEGDVIRGEEGTLIFDEKTGTVDVEYV
jgi:diaminopimelate epimerase